MTARDNRVPQKFGTGVITVIVNKDDYMPQITNGILNIIDAPVSENANIGSSVAVVGAADQDIIEDQEVRFLSSYVQINGVSRKLFYLFLQKKHTVFNLITTLCA